MSGIKDQESIDELRQRLYSRGQEVSEVERHDLTDSEVTVARDWQVAEPKVAVSDDHVVIIDPMPKHRYRKFILFGSLGIFAFVALFAGLYVFLGGNKISGENINFNLAGPTTVGGSDVMSFQASITNQNDVGVEKAVLVLKYPSGTRTASEPAKNVYEERINIGTLTPGEVKNIPIQVGIYGKENEEKQIEATFEYRIASSDGTFYKNAEPLRFRITSSPVTLQVSSIGKVAAGQPVEVTLTAKSNSSKPLKDVLVTASFPNGFNFKESDPQPIYNQNTWKIEELLPEQVAKITLKGTINGLTEERFAINFSAGLAETDNQYIVGSTLAEARSEFAIESPFIAVDIGINGDEDRDVILEQGENGQVEVTIKNTLDETVYDMVVEVVPNGNALRPDLIESNGGFYDSNKNVVRWETANNQDFSQIRPGTSRTVSFSISPANIRTTATFDVTVNVYARRVAESSAQEQLVGTVTAKARYSASIALNNQLNPMSGPVPPKVGQTSTYLVTFVASAGGNDVTNATINTSLPAYVEWLNDYSGPGTLDYNPINKQIEWKPGDIKANTKRELVFSVSILPSISQVGMVPVLVNRQTIRAVDRFTNTPLIGDADQINAKLSSEMGYQETSGLVTQ
ncbi:MAG: hypothetical protein RL538_501 [Candidatus Parcubacteria bacterium]|jgi:hypothetical protein